MKQLADGVWQLDGTPRDAVNVYVVGDVLVDAGTMLDGKRILRQVEGRAIAAHALTHGHPDHYGSSHAVCERLGVPLWVGDGDADYVAAGKMLGPAGLTIPAAKAHPVARRLKEGDEVAGFAVLETPGHSPGHVSFWRESDRVLLCGDVMWGWNPFLTRGPIRPPFNAFTPDVRANRESARRIAALEPALVCFGHGPPLRDDPARLAAAVAKLPG